MSEMVRDGQSLACGDGFLAECRALHNKLQTHLLLAFAASLCGSLFFFVVSFTVGSVVVLAALLATILVNNNAADADEALTDTDGVSPVDDDRCSLALSKCASAIRQALAHYAILAVGAGVLLFLGVLGPNVDTVLLCLGSLSSVWALGGCTLLWRCHRRTVRLRELADLAPPSDRVSAR